jgi:sarcosine oxidase/L-pipecolate oxidase
VRQCWIIGHLQLTPEEATPLAGIPVVYHDELVRRGASSAVYRSRAPQGFFFEPRENGVVKVCNEFAGYTRVRRA